MPCRALETCQGLELLIERFNVIIDAVKHLSQVPIIHAKLHTNFRFVKFMCLGTLSAHLHFRETMQSSKTV
jgi:hypothetical protein